MLTETKNACVSLGPDLNNAYYFIFIHKIYYIYECDLS